MTNPTIGLKNIVYAIQTSDTVAAVSYSSYLPVAEACTSKVTAKITSDVQWMDDAPLDIQQTEAETTVEFSIRDLPLSVQAAFFGHSYANGTIIKKYTDIPPFVSIAFKSLKADKINYRYVKLLKGKFEQFEADAETLADKTKVENPTISGTFIKRIFDDQWERVADTDDPTYIASVGTNWFTYVENPTDITPPTVASVVPAAAATSVAITAAVVWTMSEAIQNINLGLNFTLINSATAAQVPATVTMNALGTIITLVPTASLTAAQSYYAIVNGNIKDLQGNPIAAPYSTKFSC
jgi:phi13 family phage major tail protein